MTDWLKRYQHAGCLRKATYWHEGQATRKAIKASRKTGELIIAYECFSCGGWHIGHADETQLAARNMQQGDPLPLCSVCGKLIPPRRLRKAARLKSVTTTCSPACTARARRQRRREREAQNPPPPPVSEGSAPDES